MKRRRVYADRSKSQKKYRSRSSISTFKAPVSSKGVSKVSPRSTPSTRLNNTFIYNDTVFLNPGLGATAEHDFRLSSLFDPDQTGIGHQPTNFDQLMLLYERYCVYEVEYRITFVSDLSSTNYIVGATVCDLNTAAVDRRVLIENGQTQWGVLGLTTSSNQITFRGTCDIAKSHGVTKKAMIGDPDYSGSSSTNPIENIFLKIWAGDIFLGSDPPQISAIVELRMKTQLEGSKLNNIS